MEQPAGAIPFIVAACALFLHGCRFTAPDPGADDTPTSGKVLILADVDSRPVIEQEASIFNAIYDNAAVEVRYMTEGELLKAMMNDSVRCVVTSGAYGPEQQADFARRKLKALPVVPIYTDAIAVVVNKASPITRLDLAHVKAILDADTTTLHVTGDVESTSAISSLRAVFAGSGSGVARMLIDSLHLKGIRGGALADVASVIAQVSRDERAIGFIPFAAISDLDDPDVLVLRERVKLLPLSAASGTVVVLPSQSTIADGRYPLRRTINMLLTEGKSGLGTGFVSFVANHKGQRIILKLGVAPIMVPPRNIEIVHQ